MQPAQDKAQRSALEARSMPASKRLTELGGEAAAAVWVYGDARPILSWANGGTSSDVEHEQGCGDNRGSQGHERSAGPGPWFGHDRRD